MKQPAGQRGTLLAVAVVFAVASVVAACTSAATFAPGNLPPLGLHGGGSTADFVDSFGPGVPFAWGIIVENRTSSAVSMDGYELLGRSQGLDVLGAGLLLTAPATVGYRRLSQADSDLQAAVAAHPIAGASLGSSSDPGWAKGGWFAFVLRASAVGDYTVSGIRLRYHVAGSSFDTTIPATLEVCAGATVAPGDTCPYASRSPG